MKANSAGAHGAKPCGGMAHVSLVMYGGRTEPPPKACYETYQDPAPANEPQHDSPKEAYGQSHPKVMYDFRIEGDIHHLRKEPKVVELSDNHDDQSQR